MKFYASGVDALQRLLVVPLFLYGAWKGYTKENIVLASSFSIVSFAFLCGIIWERRRALFVFEDQTLHVRDFFGASYDICLDNITGIDESPWVGIKLFVNFQPRRLLIDRLSQKDKKKFLSVLREKSALNHEHLATRSAGGEEPGDER